MKLFLGGAWRDITAGQIFISGSWHKLASAQQYNGGQWRTIANFTPPGTGGGGGGSMTLKVSPNPCGSTTNSTTISTPFCTVTPFGGLAPYTYSWTATNGARANTPTQASCNFTMMGVAQFNEVDAIATCVVKDSLGVTASISVNLFFDHDSRSIQ